MTMALVVAVDTNFAIGKDGQMPWHLPDELRYFKQVTQGHPVLMGYNTALAIGRALPGRKNIVLSRRHSAPFAEQHTVTSLEAARAEAGGQTLMVIGGGQIYRLTLPHAQDLYLTYVETAVAGADTFFPAVDFRHWQEVSRERHEKDARHAHAFEAVHYVRQ